MKKMFVGNLPLEASEDSVREMFSACGTMRSISAASDIFIGRCRGFGSGETEGCEARAAQAALDGILVGNSHRSLRVRFDDPRTMRGGRKRRQPAQLPVPRRLLFSGLTQPAAWLTTPCV